MLAHADELGANAVIGVRYDATEIMSGVTEVLCYGTAASWLRVTPADAALACDTAEKHRPQSCIGQGTP